jgi:hypothetical protein
VRLSDVLIQLEEKLLQIFGRVKGIDRTKIHERALELTLRPIYPCDDPE